MNKKILGAVLSGIVFIIYLAVIITFIVYVQLTSFEKIPLGVFVYLLFALLIPFIGIIYALYSRVGEIIRGEEEESKKY